MSVDGFKSVRCPSKRDVRLIKLSVNREFTINREGEGRIRDSTRGLKAARISQILYHNLFSVLTQRLRKFEKSEYTMIFEKGVGPV